MQVHNVFLGRPAPRRARRARPAFAPLRGTVFLGRLCSFFAQFLFNHESDLSCIPNGCLLFHLFFQCSQQTSQRHPDDGG